MFMVFSFKINQTARMNEFYCFGADVGVRVFSGLQSIAFYVKEWI